jgi:hypothetical protein
MCYALVDAKANVIDGLCEQCMGLICPACVGRACVPFLKRLDEMEERARFLATLAR